jgi:nucleoside-diphosphate-sugar epimerase
VASQQIAAVMLLEDAPIIVNIANGVSYSLNEIVEMIEEITGQEVRSERLERRTCDLRNSRLNNALLRELTGFEPPDLRNELTSILGSIQ